MLVTLIGEKLAKEGSEFIYLGPNSECRGCKLKTVCFNLKPGRRYRIMKVRDKRHSCSVHEGDAVVIEAKEMPITAAINRKLSEGSIAKIEKKECDNTGCTNYKLCHNIALQRNRKYKIIKIHERLDCPLGYNLQKAELIE